MNLKDLVDRGVLNQNQASLVQQLGSAGREITVPDPPRLSREKMWSLAPATAEIVTELLDGVDKSPGRTTIVERWLARIGKVLWLFVEATVPRKPFYTVLRYWFQVLFTLSCLLLLLTFFGVWKESMPVAAKVVGALIGIYLLTETLRGFIARRTDVILNSTGTISFVIGVIMLLYMSLVNGLSFEDFSSIQTRSSLTLFALLCLPMVSAFLSWLVRKIRFSRNGPLSFRDRLKSFVMSLRFKAWALSLRKVLAVIRKAAGRVVIVLYAAVLLLLSSYLFLNPRPSSDSKRSLPLLYEETVPKREPSDSEKMIEAEVNRVWSWFGWKR